MFEAIDFNFQAYLYYSGISDSTLNNIVLLYRFCLVTLSGSQSRTSPNRYMTGLIGPGAI